jgi:hypothetical protein
MTHQAAGRAGDCPPSRWGLSPQYGGLSPGLSPERPKAREAA